MIGGVSVTDCTGSTDWNSITFFAIVSVGSLRQVCGGVGMTPYCKQPVCLSDKAISVQHEAPKLSAGEQVRRYLQGVAH